jgi:protein-disulfide isomerase
LGKDFNTLKGSPTAAVLALIWVVASAGLVLAFPREPAVGEAASAATAAPAVPVETLAPEQLTELHAWLDRQPTVADAMPQGEVKVLLLKFNDYQCPSCRQAYFLYNDIITKYEAAYPGVFKYESRDFPLEPECGAGGVHGAACEAAVAVRLAREKNLDKKLEAVLFERQSMSMTRDDVKSVLREVTQISDSEFDSRYPKLLEAVRQDVQLGQKVGVTGTPTFYINGIRLGGFRPAAFDAVIAYQLRKAGVTS